jgi:protein-L-isoaspartate(D-aspartate) O-methyltransferase
LLFAPEWLKSVISFSRKKFGRAMTDFAAARRTMVENQLRTYDVTDQTLLAAFETVPREAFVAPAQAAFAYLDREVLARDVSTRLLTPMVLARMIQALELNRGEKVLDVGGAGYGAALLNACGVEAVSLDRDPEAVKTSLSNAGVTGVTVVGGHLAEGAAAHGPFDAILVNGSAETEPTALLAQLKDDGALVIVIGHGRSGRARLFKRIGDKFSSARVIDASAPALAEFARKPEFAF